MKTALLCISFPRKGEVLAYVGRIHNLKDLKDVTLIDGCITQLGSRVINKKEEESSPVSPFERFRDRQALSAPGSVQGYLADKKQPLLPPGTTIEP